jgi:hypothetical protein
MKFMLPYSKSKKSIAVCSVCWKAWDRNAAAESEAEIWISLDDLVTKKELATEDYLLSDGYCPECAAALLLECSVRHTPQRRAFHHI